MDTFFGILLIIFLVLVLVWPYLNRWLGPALQRWMMGRIEDRMRRMAGMPTRKEERKMRSKAAKARGRGADRESRWDSFRDRRTAGGYTGAGNAAREPIIPKEYAEDVEFVEIKSYSEESEVVTMTSADGKREKIVTEEQVEDVEFVEVRNNKDS